MDSTTTTVVEKALSSPETEIHRLRTVEAGFASSPSRTIQFRAMTPDGPVPVATLVLAVGDWNAKEAQAYIGAVIRPLARELYRWWHHVIDTIGTEINMLHANAADVVKMYFFPPAGDSYLEDGRTYFATLRLYVGDFSPVRSQEYVSAVEASAVGVLHATWNNAGVLDVTELLASGEVAVCE